MTSHFEILSIHNNFLTCHLIICKIFSVSLQSYTTHHVLQLLHSCCHNWHGMQIRGRCDESAEVMGPDRKRPQRLVQDSGLEVQCRRCLPPKWREVRIGKYLHAQKLRDSNFINMPASGLLTPPGCWADSRQGWTLPRRGSGSI